MGKARNRIPSEPLQVTTTPQVRRLLERLVDTGLYGKNTAEAAERLIALGLRRELVQGVLVERPRR